jgi:hypothetical protein
MNDDRPLDCGSGCRGFNSPYSPLNADETPRGDIPQSPLGGSASTGYSPNIVQSPICAEPQPPETDSLAGAVQVPLGHGLFALVDAADAERVLAKRWHVWRKPGRPDVVYAQHTFRHKSVNGVRGKSDVLWLHRFVLGAEKGVLVDHRDGRGLDCRRHNLRAATRRQNSQNVTLSKNQRAGGFKGVSGSGSSWCATIRGGEIGADGKRTRVHLGTFPSAELAARAYDRKALEVFGPFSSLNFPDPEAEQFAVAMGEAAEVRGVKTTLPYTARKRSTGGGL